jgi:hypothetical protein
MQSEQHCWKEQTEADQKSPSGGLGIFPQHAVRDACGERLQIGAGHDLVVFGWLEHGVCQGLSHLAQGGHDAIVRIFTVPAGGDPKISD